MNDLDSSGRVEVPITSRGQGRGRNVRRVVHFRLASHASLSIAESPISRRRRAATPAVVVHQRPSSAVAAATVVAAATAVGKLRRLPGLR